VEKRTRYCRYDEWIDIDRVIQRQDDIDSTEDNKSNDPDTGSKMIEIINLFSLFLIFSMEEFIE
jgi:hypothetical protein